MNLENRRAPYRQRASNRLAGAALAAALLLSSPATAQLIPLEFPGTQSLHVPAASITPTHPRDLTSTWIGSVTTQGDALMSAPLARSNYGVDGSGIKVGIISDSFNFLGGQPTGISTGNLPGAGNPNNYLMPVNILNDDNFAGSIDEGRAMAELVHDVAPGAQILFHSAFNNAETSPGGSIAVAINNLVAAGCDIIVDDVFDVRTPAYQDGVAAQAVSNAFANGVAYFSSAGNNSNNAYEGTYSPIFGTNHNFDANANEGGDNILDIGTIPNNGSVLAALWWEDPYPSLSAGTPTTDFHLGLYDFTSAAVVSGSAQNQLTGADPWEAFQFTNTTGATHQYGLFVQDAGGVSSNKLLKIQVFGRTIQDDDDTNSPTTGGHNSADGAVAVAAAGFNNINVPESFTAQGPTTILYGPTGNHLAAPQIRNAPQITGIDGGNTSFFFSDSGLDADSFPNFFGTSASAPMVAAVAALVMERAADVGLTLTPTDVYNILFNSTVDIGAPGFDNLTGWGRLDALLAVSHVVPEPGTVSMWLVAMGLLVGRHRRRVRAA